MDLPGLVGQLAANTSAIRRAAADALVDAGPVAVGPVLAALRDEGSPVDWVDSASVLRRLGEPALAPLVEVIATARTAEVRRRAGWAFSGLELADKAAYLPALRHPHPAVRDRATYVLQLLGVKALPYVPALIPLLVDPDERVRQRAVWVFEEIGAKALKRLRQVRRSAAPERRLALTALAGIAGWRGLGKADRALVERLIRVKLTTEVPAPMHLCGPWYALPTTDQAAVLDALGLSDAVPVTMRLGDSAWNIDQHDLFPQSRHQRCARVYVSPGLDGWTLVFGDHSDDPHATDGSEDALRAVRHRRTASLSRTFGAAHWYGMSCGDGWTAWCLAGRGEVVRGYDIHAPDQQIGPRHPAEADDVLPHEGSLLPDWCDATTVAGRISVDSSALGPHIRVDGHGVLALTGCGRRHGHPPGALAS